MAASDYFVDLLREDKRPTPVESRTLDALLERAIRRPEPQRPAQPLPEPPAMVPPTGFMEHAAAGAQAAGHGMLSSIHAIRAMLSRRPENRAEALRDMAHREEMANVASYGVQPFEEFWEDAKSLDFSGFGDQAGFALGMVLPSIALSAGTWGAGGVAASAVAKGAASYVGRNVAAKWATDVGRDLLTKEAKREARDNFTNVVEKIAKKQDLTPDEKELGKYVGRATVWLEGRGMVKPGTAGAVLGAWGPESALAFGEAGKELLDPEVLEREGFPTAGEKFGAALVGGLSGSLNIAAEAAVVLRLLKKSGISRTLATDKDLDAVADLKKTKILGVGMSGFGAAATVGGRMAGRVAARGAESAVLEGTTEAMQESLLVGFRSLTDPEHKFANDLMRIGHAAFVGAVGGGQVALGGAALTTPAGLARQAFRRPTPEAEVPPPAAAETWADLRAQFADTLDQGTDRTSVRVGGPAVNHLRKMDALNKAQRAAVTAAWKAGGEHQFNVPGVGRFIVKNTSTDPQNPNLYFFPADEAAAEVNPAAPDAVREVITAVDELGDPSAEMAGSMLGRYPEPVVADDVEKVRVVVSNDDGSVVQNQVVSEKRGEDARRYFESKAAPGQTVSVYHSQEYEPRQAAHELEVSAEPMVDPDSPDFVDREAPEVTDEQYREMERNAALASQPPVPYVTSLEVEQAKPEATPVQQAVALLEAPKDAPKAIREFTRMPMPPQENIKPPPPPESVVFEPAVATVAKQALVEKMPDIRARLLDYGRRTTETAEGAPVEETTVEEPPSGNQMLSQFETTSQTYQQTLERQPAPAVVPDVVPPTEFDPNEAAARIASTVTRQPEVEAQQAEADAQRADELAREEAEANRQKDMDIARGIVELMGEREQAVVEALPWKLPELDPKALRAKAAGKAKRLGASIQKALGTMPSPVAERMRDLLMFSNDKETRDLRREVERAEARGAYDSTETKLIRDVLLEGSLRRSQMVALLKDVQAGKHIDPADLTPRMRDSINRFITASRDVDPRTASRAAAIVADAYANGSNSQVWALEMLDFQFKDLVESPDVHAQRETRLYYLEETLKRETNKNKRKELAYKLSIELRGIRYNEEMPNLAPLDVFLQPELVVHGVRRLMRTAHANVLPGIAVEMRAKGETTMLKAIDEIVGRVVLNETPVVRPAEETGDPALELTPEQESNRERWRFAVAQTGGGKFSENIYAAAAAGQEQDIEVLLETRRDDDRQPGEIEDDTADPVPEDYEETGDILPTEVSLIEHSTDMTEQDRATEGQEVFYGPDNVKANGGWVVAAPRFRGPENWQITSVVDGKEQVVVSNQMLRNDWERLMRHLEPTVAAKFLAYEDLLHASAVRYLTDRKGELWRDVDQLDIDIMEGVNDAGRQIITITRPISIGGSVDAYVHRRTMTTIAAIFKGAKRQGGHPVKVAGKWQWALGEDDTGVVYHVQDDGETPVSFDTIDELYDSVMASGEEKKRRGVLVESPVEMRRHAVLTDEEGRAFLSEEIGDDAEHLGGFTAPAWTLSAVTDLGRTINREYGVKLAGSNGNMLNQAQDNLKIGYEEMLLKGIQFLTDDGDMLDNANTLVRAEQRVVIADDIGGNAVEQAKAKLADMRENLPETAAALNLPVSNKVAGLTLRAVLTPPPPQPHMKGLGWDEITSQNFEPHLLTRQKLLDQDPELYRDLLPKVNEILRKMLVERGVEGARTVRADQMPAPGVVSKWKKAADQKAAVSLVPQIVKGSKQRQALARSMIYEWSDGVDNAYGVYEREQGLNAAIVEEGSHYDPLAEERPGLEGDQEERMFSEWRKLYPEAAAATLEMKAAEKQLYSTWEGEPSSSLPDEAVGDIAQLRKRGNNVKADELEKSARARVNADLRRWAVRMKIAARRHVLASTRAYNRSYADEQYDGMIDVTGISDKIANDGAVNAHWARYLRDNPEENPATHRLAKRAKTYDEAVEMRRLGEVSGKRLSPMTAEGTDMFIEPRANRQTMATLEEVKGAFDKTPAAYEGMSRNSSLALHEAREIAKIDNIPIPAEVWKFDVDQFKENLLHVHPELRDIEAAVLARRDPDIAPPQKVAETQRPAKKRRPLDGTNQAYNSVMPLLKGLMPEGAPKVHVLRSEDLMLAEGNDVAFSQSLLARAKQVYVEQTDFKVPDAEARTQGFVVFDKDTGEAVIVSNYRQPPGLTADKNSPEYRAARKEWLETQKHEALTIAHEYGHVWLRLNQRRFFQDDGTFTGAGESMWAAYQLHRDNVSVQQYTDDLKGFDEFVADQVAAYAIEGEPSFARLKKLAATKTGKERSLLNKAIVRIRQIAQDLMRFVEQVGKRIYGNRFRKNVEAQETIARIVAESNERSMNDRWKPDAPVSSDVLGDVAQLQLDVTRSIRNVRPRDVMDFSRKFMKQGAPAGVMNALVPTVTQLRLMGKSGAKLADLLHRKSRANDAREGFFSKHMATMRKEFVVFAKAVGVKNPFGSLKQFKEPELKAALHEAAIAGDIDAEGNFFDAAEPSEKAQAILDVFKRLEEKYPVLTEEGKRQRYFPRGLKWRMLETETGQRRMLDLMTRFLKNEDGVAVSYAEAREILDGIFAKRQDTVDSQAGTEGPLEGEGFTPGVPNILRRSLEKIPTRELIAAGLAETPLQAATNYVNTMSRRVVFDELNMGEEVPKLIDEIVGTGDPEAAANRAYTAEKLVRSAMGQHGIELGPVGRTLADFQRTAAVWTLLPLSLLSQPPEIGFAMTRAQGVVSFADSMRQLLRMSSIKDNIELARAVGVVGPSAQEAMFATVGALDYQSAASRRANEWFFRAVGLDAFTTFIKGFSSGLGREFMLGAAKDPTERNQRFLRELNVTKDEVLAWEADGFSLENRPEIESALRIFVSEGTVSPNPSTRPGLGNDPRFAFLYLLKSFFYSSGVQILSGIARESKARWGAGERGSAVMFVSYAAITTLPLAIVSLEMREYVKWGLRAGLQGVGVDTPDPAAAFLSDSMGSMTYLSEIVDRAGLLGPFSIAKIATDSMAYDENLVVAMVPSLDFVGEVISGNAEKVMPGMRTL